MFLSPFGPRTRRGALFLAPPGICLLVNSPGSYLTCLKPSQTAVRPNKNFAGSLSVHAQKRRLKVVFDSFLISYSCITPGGGYIYRPNESSLNFLRAKPFLDTPGRYATAQQRKKIVTTVEHLISLNAYISMYQKHY